MRWMVTIGRILFAAIFVLSGLSHFSAATIAQAAAHGVPGATVLVPLSGLIAIVGGLSIALGWRTRMGAWLLVVFLVPVTFMMHNFWAFPDPVQAMQQQFHFMKNLSMLGAAMIFTYMGAAPAVRERREPAARERPLETVGR